MRAHAYAHVHSAPNEGIGTAVKKSLEIISKQVRLEDGFKRGGRIRVAECLRQIVPDRCVCVCVLYSLGPFKTVP